MYRTIWRTMMDMIQIALKDVKLEMRNIPQHQREMVWCPMMPPRVSLLRLLSELRLLLLQHPLRWVCPMRVIQDRGLG